MYKRSIITAALAAGAALTLVSSAFAAEQTQLSTTVSPAGKKVKDHRPVALKFAIKGIGAGADLTVSKLEFALPKDVVLDASKFGRCSVEQAKDGMIGCPKNSLIGTGSAEALIGSPVSSAKTPMPLDLTLFAAGKNNLTLHVKSLGGISMAFAIPVVKAGGKAGQKLVIEIPQRLQTPFPGGSAFLRSFSAQIAGKTKVKKNEFHLLTAKKANAKNHSFRTDMHFVTPLGSPQVPSVALSSTAKRVL